MVLIWEFSIYFWFNVEKFNVIFFVVYAEPQPIRKFRIISLHADFKILKETKIFNNGGILVLIGNKSSTVLI